MHIADFARGHAGRQRHRRRRACRIAARRGAGGPARRARTDVSVCFFGDGAANRGRRSTRPSTSPRSGSCPSCSSARTTSTRPTTRVGVQHPRRRHRRRAPRPTGCPGVIVDGNDVLEVDAARGEAVARARSGGGPTLSSARPIAGTSMPCGPPRRRRPVRPTRSPPGKRATRIARLEQHALGRGLLSAARDRRDPRGRRGRSRRRRGVRRAEPVPRSEGSAGRHVRGLRRRGAGHARDQLPEGARRGGGRGDASRPAGHHHRRPISPATRQGVRPRAGALHAHLRVGADRHRPGAPPAAASAPS